jgi:hypothetical protein
LEKIPDLQAEREEKLKAVRKKEQAAKLDRVRFVLQRHYPEADFAIEKGRGENCSGEEREEMAERPCI